MVEEARETFRRSAGVPGVGWLAALATAAAVVLPLTVLGPFEIYARNAGEFSVALGEVLTRLLPLAIAGLALFTVLIRVLPARHRVWAVGLGLGLGAAFYAQSSLLSWDYGQFDGTGIDWEAHRWHGIVDIVAWSVLLLAGLLARRWLARHAVLLAGALLAVQVGNTAISVVGNDLDWWQQSGKTVNDGVFELSPDLNAVVVVLDAFSTPVFEQVIERKPELASEFTGFTFFPNTISTLATTWMSIPAMLTGVVFHNDRSGHEYLASVFSRQSLVSDLEKAGFRTDLITLGQYCAKLKADSCLTPSSAVSENRSALRNSESLRLTDLVLFRYFPHAIKKRIYSNGQLMLTSWLAPIRDGINWKLSDTLGVVRLLSDRLHVGDHSQGAFKFIHLMVPHHPYHLDRWCHALPPDKRDNNAGGRLFLEQGECALRLTAQLLRKLKALGVYDQTAVIVVADHGFAKRRYYPNARAFAQFGLNRALALLLVKPMRSDGLMRRSSAPATNADVARTVAELLGLKTRLPGRNVMALEEDAHRTRRYYHYIWRKGWWGRAYLPPVQEYILEGNPRNTRHWRQGQEFPPKR